MASHRTTGFEFEGIFNVLPQFSEESAPLLLRLSQNDAQGESGPAWNTLVSFVLATAALKRKGLKAGIYQGAFDQLTQLLGNDHPDVIVISHNLHAAGFLIPGYQRDTFGIGFDSSTTALPPANEHYFRTRPDIRNPFSFKQFCGFEVNGPVSDDPFLMGDQFRTMLDAFRPLGLLTPSSCGIHQHIGIADLTYRNLADLMRIQAFCDTALRENVFPPHRRDSRFCRPLHYHITPLGNIPPLVLLSNRLDQLCQEYDGYAAAGIDQTTLLKRMAFDIQANIFPSGKVNETFYGITDSILCGTLEQDLEEHILNLRRQRYFDPSPESPYTKLTLEKRWMPATDNPEFVLAWFILNYVGVDRITTCESARIICDPSHANCRLLINDTSGHSNSYTDSFDDIMRYMNIPQDLVSQDLLLSARDSALWGDDPLDQQDDPTGNRGLWPQAPVPFASRHSDDPVLASERLAIYAATERAFLGEQAVTSTVRPTPCPLTIMTIEKQLANFRL